MIRVDVLYFVMGVGTQILLSAESGDLLVDAGDGLTREIYSNDVMTSIV